MSATGLSFQEISVCVQDACVCGQTHNVIYRMKVAEVTVGRKPCNFDFSKGFVSHIEPKTKLDFSGDCYKIELNGVERKEGRGVVCKGCGINLVYSFIVDEV